MSTTPHLIYALLWLSFGVAHSWLASLRTKASMEPHVGYRYRVLYNLVSALHIVAVVQLGHWLYRAQGGFALASWQSTALTVLWLTGGVFIIFALAQYDLGLFSGLKQWRQGRAAGSRVQPLQAVPSSNTGLEPLHLDGLHCYMRHPLYCALFMMLWGNAGYPFGLATALWGSIYLVVGTWFEERKLLSDYGDDYARYRQHVPAFFPWKGRVSWSSSPLKPWADSEIDPGIDPDR